MPADWARVDERSVSCGMCDGAAKLLLNIHSTGEILEKVLGQSYFNINVILYLIHRV